MKSATQVSPAVVKGNNALALDLYGRLRTSEGNLFLSPYSVSTALAMTHAGARGETAAQMAGVLHFDLPPEELHPAFRALIEHINGSGAEPPRPYQLLTANALWGQKGDPFLDGFLKLTRENYGAGLRDVDFKSNAEGARQEINAWVEEQTRDKIKDLLSSADVTPATSLILTNAIYFKGDWLRPFSPGATQADGRFKTASGKQVTTPMMSQTASFAYQDGGTFQHLMMMYAGGTLAMDILLPKSQGGLAALEAQIDAAKLATWQGKLREARVSVFLPKFTMTAQFRLSDVLRSMGLTLPFDAGRADFSGINGKRDLSISEVIHKAFVDVNEKGTEAAAATAVAMVRSSAAIPAPPIEFKADHPFLFLIRDLPTGGILFLGRLNDPTS